MPRAGFALKGAPNAIGNPATVELAWLWSHQLTVYSTLHPPWIERCVSVNSGEAVAGVGV